MHSLSSVGAWRGFPIFAWRRTQTRRECLIVVSVPNENRASGKFGKAQILHQLAFTFHNNDVPIFDRNDRFDIGGELVVCKTGSYLGRADAAAQRSNMIALPIKVSEGLQLSSPATVLSLGKRYVFMFQERVSFKVDEVATEIVPVSAPAHLH
jgi:hypothetical protein